MATQATYTLVSPPTPGLDPPPGVIPTFHQPYTLQPYVELTISLAIIITTVLVATRFYVKVWIIKKLLIEDYLCFVGWVSRVVHPFLPFEHLYTRRIQRITFWSQCDFMDQCGSECSDKATSYAKCRPATSSHPAFGDCYNSGLFKLDQLMAI